MGKGLLIIVVGFSTIYTGVMFNMSSSQQGSSREIVRQYHHWLRNNATESVTNVALSQIYRGILPDDTLDFSGATSIVRSFDTTVDSINQVVTLGVEVATSYADGTDSTYTGIMWPAYSFYNYFMHSWPAHRIFVTNDTAWGPIHADNKIKISGNPVFMGRISSHNHDGFSGGGNPKFLGGAEFDTETIPVPNAAALSPLLNIASTGGDWFTQPLWLIFQADSTYSWSTDGIIWSAGTKLSDYNGTIGTSAGNDIIIRGTVAGRMTVISGRDIIIQDTLRYKTNPRINSTSQDYIGLIAEGRVIFQFTASPGMVVNAALMAADIGTGSVVLDNQFLVNADLALTFLGSIVAKKDSLSTTTLPLTSLAVNSFDLIHWYDARLRMNTSPYYPRLTGRIEPYMRGFITAME